MRALFLVTGGRWNAQARAFLLAARGLKARGHEVVLACETDCPVQVRAGEAEVPVLTLGAGSGTAATVQLRKALQERGADAVFVHSEAELFMAGSALRLLGRRAGGAAVIRRVPPFATVAEGRRARLTTRIAPTGLLFSTNADRERAAGGKHRRPAMLAPLAVDPAEHDRVKDRARDALGVPADATLIVCVHDAGNRHSVLTALRAVGALAPRHRNVHLVVLGGGRQDELRMEGAALGVNTLVSYLGAREDELAVMRAADIGWIAATGADAAALAAMDFMALRKPILAERSALLEHYVADGVGGVLLPVAESQVEMTHVAAAVAAFLARPEQRTTMGRAGRARLEREFPYEAMIRGYEEAVGGAPERGQQTVA